MSHPKHSLCLSSVFIAWEADLSELQGFDLWLPEVGELVALSVWIPGRFLSPVPEGEGAGALEILFGEALELLALGEVDRDWLPAAPGSLLVVLLG